MTGAGYKVVVVSNSTPLWDQPAYICQLSNFHIVQIIIHTTIVLGVVIVVNILIL